MRSLAFISWLALFASAQEYYNLQSSFLGGPTFLDNFDFWTSWDPTYGFVQYVDRATAESYSMINTTGSSVSFGVDTTQTLDPNANLGRPSLRLTSFESWTHGLFILDLAHMPPATCGTWPAFWSLGGTGTWPMSGEIDIIEYVNSASNNLATLHTMPGCSIAGADTSGKLLSSDCAVSTSVAGCSVQSTSPSNLGSSFNDNGGGVYAMEWTSTAIRSPNVDSFGLPSANFQGSCDIDRYFYNHSLVFDIDFCGQWAGSTFVNDGCPSQDPSNSWASCNQYVAANPGAFTETYWEVNYLNVYQLASGTSPPTSTPLSSVTPAISSSQAVTTGLSNGPLGRSSTPTMSIAAVTSVVTTNSSASTSSVLSVPPSIPTSSASTSPADANAVSVAATSGTPNEDSILSSSTSSAPTSMAVSLPATPSVPPPPTPPVPTPPASAPPAAASAVSAPPASVPPASVPPASAPPASAPTPSVPPPPTPPVPAPPASASPPAAPTISAPPAAAATPISVAAQRSQSAAPCFGDICTVYKTADTAQTISVDLSGLDQELREIYFYKRAAVDDSRQIVENNAETSLRGAMTPRRELETTQTSTGRKWYGRFGNR